MRVVLLALLIAVASARAHADERPRFRPIDVYVDSGDAALAAYQIEITAPGCGEIAGVEGGEHAAFRAAPFYDPAALRGGRIVIGAFSTAADLPRGRTRVAKLHMRENKSPCDYATRLVAAASPGGERMAAIVSLNVSSGGSDE